MDNPPANGQTDRLMSQSSSQPSPSKLAAILWAAAVVGIVGSIVAAGWWMQAERRKPAEQLTTTVPSTVSIDHDYYFFVRLVEFHPKRPNGKTWDSGNSSAPDAEIVLYWRGNRTFSWAERNDQLIATWDLFRVDIKDLISNGGKMDLAAAINAPIVRVTSNEAVTIEVWDDDPAMSDLALKMDIPLAQLRDGRNDIVTPTDSGIARLRIDMVDRATPLATLIEMQSKGG